MFVQRLVFWLGISCGTQEGSIRTKRRNLAKRRQLAALRRANRDCKVTVGSEIVVQTELTADDVEKLEFATADLCVQLALAKVRLQQVEEEDDSLQGGSSEPPCDSINGNLSSLRVAAFELDVTDHVTDPHARTDLDDTYTGGGSPSGGGGVGGGSVWAGSCGGDGVPSSSVPPKECRHTLELNSGKSTDDESEAELAPVPTFPFSPVKVTGDDCGYCVWDSAPVQRQAKVTCIDWCPRWYDWMLLICLGAQVGNFWLLEWKISMYAAGLLLVHCCVGFALADDADTVSAIPKSTKDRFMQTGGVTCAEKATQHQPCNNESDTQTSCHGDVVWALVPYEGDELAPAERDDLATALLVEAELTYSALLGCEVNGELRKHLIREKCFMPLREKQLGLRRVGRGIDEVLVKCATRNGVEVGRTSRYTARSCAECGIELAELQEVCYTCDTPAPLDC